MMECAYLQRLRLFLGGWIVASEMLSVEAHDILFGSFGITIAFHADESNFHASLHARCGELLFLEGVLGRTIHH